MQEGKNLAHSLLPALLYSPLRALKFLDMPLIKPIQSEIIGKYHPKEKL